MTMRCWRLAGGGMAVVAVVAGCGGGEGAGSGPPPTPVPVASVTVTPALDTIQIGAYAGYPVVTRDSAGHLLTGRPVTWSLSDSSLAHHSGGGTFFADEVGTVQAIATVEGVADTVIILLVPVITVDPLYPSLFAGDTTQLSARTTDIFGDPVVAPAVTWSTGSPGIAMVSGAGLVTGLAAGMGSIRASLPGAVDSQVVAVLTPRIGVNREVMFSYDTASPTASGFSELWLSNPDGTGAHRISTQDYTVLSARWSPDGSRIAFHGGLVTGATSSYSAQVMNFDGSGLITPSNPGLIPNWSPDGTRLAIYLGDGSADIGVLQANGSGWTSLQTGSAVDTRPRFSPDGRRIAWIKEIGGNTCNEVWLMSPSGGQKQKLTLPAGFRPCTVEWSPDGKELAIESVNGGIWLVRVDGTDFRALSPNCTLAGGCTAPTYASVVWNPTGTLLAFSGIEGGQPSSVNVIGHDGSGFVTVSYLNSGNPTYPQWSPDGQRLMFQVVDPADTTGAILPLVIATSDPDLQNILYGRPGVRAIFPRWRP